MIFLLSVAMTSPISPAASDRPELMQVERLTPEDLDLFWKKALSENVEQQGLVERIEVGPVAPANSEYRYAGDAPDPFLAPKLVKDAPAFAENIETEEKQMISPILVDTVDLRVGGLVCHGEDTCKALVLNKDNLGVIVEVGSPIGINGIVTQIRNDGIEVQQRQIASDGTQRYHDIFIPFNQTETSVSEEVLVPEVPAVPRPLQDAVESTPEPVPVEKAWLQELLGGKK